MLLTADAARVQRKYGRILLVRESTAWTCAESVSVRLGEHRPRTGPAAGMR